MAPSITSQSGAIKLVFDPKTRLPGEVIEGVVELDVGLARKEGVSAIGLKLRGVATTKITGNPGSASTLYRGRYAFLKQGQTLWQAATHPISSQQAATSSYPFHFTLPEGIPSSFHAHTAECTATISYAIEVVAERSGLFTSERKVGQVFSVIATATEVQLEEAQRVAIGWDGKRTTSSASKQVRRLIWGEYSTVEAQMTYPAISSFPVGVPIPVSIVVSARTKPRSRSDVSEESLLPNAKKPLFPSPPNDVAGVHFWLESHHNVKVQLNERATVEEHVHPLGGFGGTMPGHVTVTREAPMWIPDAPDEQEANGTGVGRWERKVRFDSTMTLACSPTMDVGILKCAYLLHLEVPFPGMNNNLHLRVPIHVNSGVAPFRTGAPPPYLPNLPPAYFTGEHHDWDGDDNLKPG